MFTGCCLPVFWSLPRFLMTCKLLSRWFLVEGGGESRTQLPGNIKMKILINSLKNMHYNNAFYARVGGVSITELNRLEIELLFLLDFGVTVSSRVFESYCQHLEKEVLLCTGAAAAIERPASTNTSTDNVTEISVEDTYFLVTISAS